MTNSDRLVPAVPPGHVRTVSRLPLLIGFFVGPIAWSLHEIVSEFVVADACSSGNGGFSNFMLLGVSGWRLVLLLVTGFFALLALGADLVAYRAWKGSRVGTRLTGAAGGAAGRSGWMSMAGILMSSIFLIGIIIAGIPIFWLSGCS